MWIVLPHVCLKIFKMQTDSQIRDGEPIRDRTLSNWVVSGTYRCDVQDTNFRQVKRIYWGIRVLPVGVVNLDYESALDQWKQDEIQQKQLQTGSHTVLLYTVRSED